MAKAVAIRKIETQHDGFIAVTYTYGTPTLGPAPTTENQYQDAEALKARIGEIENMIGEEGLMLLHLAITYLSQSGSFNNLTQVLNKTLTLDSFAAQPLKVT